LTKSDVLATLRLLFAKNRVDECYGDVSPTIETLLDDEGCRPQLKGETRNMSLFQTMHPRQWIANGYGVNRNQDRFCLRGSGLGTVRGISDTRALSSSLPIVLIQSWSA